MQIVHDLPAPEVFCGREEVLHQLDAAWDRHPGGIISLEGIGGCGKSALVRRWMDRFPPEEVRGLVWSFYVRPDGDAFLAELYRIMVDEPLTAAGLGRVDAVLNAVRDAGRLLVVMDGLERVQMAGGELEEAPLQHFLEGLAAEPGSCLCLITTRFPLKVEGPVTRVALGDLGRDAAMALLQARGVTGPSLDAVAARCGHHALTVSLAAGAIVEFLGGDADRFDELEDRLDWQVLPKQERQLNQVLAFYRKRLPESAAALLSRVCLFRNPVEAATLEAIFLSRPNVGGLVAALQPGELRVQLDYLRSLGLLDRSGDAWTAHPAIREFFSPAEAGGIHAAVADFLSERPGAMRPVTPEQIELFEEMVHHAIKAGEIMAACVLYWYEVGASGRLALQWGHYARGERIARRLLAGLQRPVEPAATSAGPEHLLGAASQALTSRQYHVHPDRIEWLARLNNDLAIYLDQMGHVERAARFYLRAYRRRRQQRRNIDSSRILQNLAENALMRGRLPLAGKYAVRAAVLARGLSVEEEADTFVYERYASALRGKQNHLVRWVVKEKMAGTGAALATDILLRYGDARSALQLVEMNDSVAANYADDLAHMALLHRVRATFLESSAHEDAPAAALVALEHEALSRALQWSRQTGHRTLQVQVLTCRAMLLRLSGHAEEAQATIEEAVLLARRHGFTVLLVDALVELSFHGNATAAREAWQLASSPAVDYAFGKVHALRQLQDLGEAGGERTIAILEQRLRDADPAYSPVEDVPVPIVAPSIAIWPSDVAAANPLSFYLLPLEGRGKTRFLVMGHLVRDLSSEPDPEKMLAEFRRLWGIIYPRQQASRVTEHHRLSHRDPRYQLGLLLAMAGCLDPACQVGRFLMDEHANLAGANLWAATSGDGAEVRRQRLIESLQKFRDMGGPAVVPELVAMTLYNLGSLYEETGDYQKAWSSFNEAGQRFSLVPAQVRAQHLHLLADLREECVNTLRSLQELLLRWRAEQDPPRWPPTLDLLFPVWISRYPECPASLQTYSFTPIDKEDAVVVSCRQHRLAMSPSHGINYKPSPELGDELPADLDLLRRLDIPYRLGWKTIRVENGIIVVETA